LECLLSLVIIVFVCCVCSRAVIRFFFSSRRRHTRSDRDWSSDVCSSDLRRYARPSDGVEVVGVSKVTGREIVIAATEQARAIL